MDVETMEAGRELDALVEVTIFEGTCARCRKTPAKHIEHGVTYCSVDCSNRIGDFALDDYHENRARYSRPDEVERWLESELDDYHENRARYSTSIEAAWMVVERILVRRYTWQASGNGGKAECLFMDNGLLIARDIAETLPLAICRAALKAVASERIKQIRPDLVSRAG
jgi:hypothetical protein